jgi:hypothetical protein
MAVIVVCAIDMKGRYMNAELNEGKHDIGDYEVYCYQVVSTRHVEGWLCFIYKNNKFITTYKSTETSSEHLIPELQHYLTTLD